MAAIDRRRAALSLAAAVVALAVAVVVAAPGMARAENLLSMRGAYYKEHSTRVVQPMLDAVLEPSERGRVDAHVLVDSITSASPAAGQTTEFTELRYEGGLAYTHDLGGLRVGGSFRTSTESDYDSNWLGLRAELDLFDKNTTLGLAASRGFDEITNGAGGGLSALRIEHMKSGLTSLAVTQVLTPRLVGTLVLDFIDTHGYQANIYRQVSGGPTLVPERVPSLRLRGAAYAGLRGYLPATRTTGIAGYRYYADDWGVVAHTTDLRVAQLVVPGLETRLRWRYYNQGAADFFEEIYTAQQIMDNPFVTEDEKLSGHTTQTFGLQLVVALGLFGVEGSWSEVRFDANVERIYQTTSFGNAWAAQVGMVVPLGR